MAEFNVLSLLMFLAGTVLFMVAGFAVCVALMIFCDILNLGGAFEKPAAIVIGIVFMPILLLGSLVDKVMILFTRPEILQSLRPPVFSSNGSTIKV